MSLSLRVLVSITLLIIALAVLQPVLGQPANPPQPPPVAASKPKPLIPLESIKPGGFTGSQVCRTCHPNIWATFYRNPHQKSVVDSRLQPAQQGCESCHGPGQNHIENMGGKTTIRAFSLMEPKQVLDACLTCHTQTLSRANIRRSQHSNAGVVCTSCHSIHQPQTPKALLFKRQADLCYTCHAEVRAQFSMPFKHRVNEGFMNCSDCHNPHGGNPPTWRTASRPRMMEQALSNEEPCLKCHIDKRGPFVFEHPAVRVDGCESCHNVHGSANARLLKRPTVFAVCLECHNGTPGFGRTGQGILTQTSGHNMSDPRFHNCTSCHIRVHGSNGDQYFLR
jgi:DmsE family decaheme c-type cytochrome